MILYVGLGLDPVGDFHRLVDGFLRETKAGGISDRVHMFGQALELVREARLRIRVTCNDHGIGVDGTFSTAVEFERHTALRDLLDSDPGVDRDAQQIEPLAVILAALFSGWCRHP